MSTSAIRQMSVEHLHIETVIKSLEDAAAALGRGRRLNPQKLRGVVEFLRIYADRRHHQREEALLFPILVKRGVPAQGCPIRGLNHDHEQGRALVSTLDESVAFYEQQRSGSENFLRQTLQGIIDLYRKHLWLEDAMVFPMAERLITVADDNELSEKFADLGRKIGLEVIARPESFAGSLRFQVGIPKPPVGAGVVVAGGGGRAGS